MSNTKKTCSEFSAKCEPNAASLDTCACENQVRLQGEMHATVAIGGTNKLKDHIAPTMNHGLFISAATAEVWGPSNELKTVLPSVQRAR